MIDLEGAGMTPRTKSSGDDATHEIRGLRGLGDLWMRISHWPGFEVFPKLLTIYAWRFVVWDQEMGSGPPCREGDGGFAFVADHLIAVNPLLAQ